MTLTAQAMSLGSATTDWITAVGTVFAAVGTVGAVCVALWQTVGQERFGLQLTSNSVLTIDPEGDHTVVLQMTGVNLGRRPIRINEAKFGLVVAPEVIIYMSPVAGTDLPTTLDPGDEVVAAWDKAACERIQEEQGGTLTHFEFIDSLGKKYVVPIPGMRATRKNWRLQKRYVLS